MNHPPCTNLLQLQSSTKQGLPATNNLLFENNNGHLNVLGREESPELLAVVLLDVVEDHRPGRHVDPHCKGLCGIEQLDPTLGKAALNHLFEDGQDARVVNANTTLQQLGQGHHLGKLSIRTFQPGNAFGDKVVDVPLLHVGRQVQAGEGVGVGVVAVGCVVTYLFWFLSFLCACV